jgi:hypothetical protein
MKKTVIGLTAITALLLAGQASALTLENTILDYSGGPVSFKFSGYTQTVEGSTQGAFALTNFYESTTAGSESELASWAPTVGNYVYAVVGGFTDIDSGNPSLLWSTGGFFSLYETTTLFNTSTGPSVISAITGSGGNLLLTGDFVEQNADGATLVQSFNFNNADDFNGSGNAYADLTGGSLMAKLNTNMEKFGSDLWFSFNYSHTATNAVNWGPAGVFITDPVVGTAAVPEPATILLFGTGLAGLAGLRRKKA